MHFSLLRGAVIEPFEKVNVNHLEHLSGIKVLHKLIEFTI